MKKKKKTEKEEKKKKKKLGTQKSLILENPATFLITVTKMQTNCNTSETKAKRGNNTTMLKKVDVVK